MQCNSLKTKSTLWSEPHLKSPIKWKKPEDWKHNLHFCEPAYHSFYPQLKKQLKSKNIDQRDSLGWDINLTVDSEYSLRLEES